MVKMYFCGSCCMWLMSSLWIVWMYRCPVSRAKRVVSFIVSGLSFRSGAGEFQDFLISFGMIEVLCIKKASSSLLCAGCNCLSLLPCNCCSCPYCEAYCWHLLSRGCAFLLEYRQYRRANLLDVNIEVNLMTHVCFILLLLFIIITKWPNEWRNTVLFTLRDVYIYWIVRLNMSKA